MTYIIDHKNKFIHELTYKEKRFGVEVLRPDTNELTNSRHYVRDLEKEKMYAKCPYCHQVPLIID